eukprot:TRINITY_DN47730_c0_g1_i1.p1 TRINITY_DN47730_c0_g1~~TRINITY_DN47730_c0_g1_i1.p1  ORF type:complete len:250 (+),score=52.66 TRINITY_DN47730_c0_g1_i1:76-825(+)
MADALKEPMTSAGNINLSGQPREASAAADGFAGGGSMPTSSQQASGPSGVAEQYLQQAMGQAAGQMLHNAAGRASDFFTHGATEIRVFVEQNHYSVHALSFLGGLALIVLSLFTVLNPLSLLFPFNYLQKLFELMFGITICVIDGPSDKIPVMGPRLERLLIENAPFLYKNKGRALLYFFIAGLEGARDWSELLKVAIGVYFLGIGVIHVALTASGGQRSEADAGLSGGAEGRPREARAPQFAGVSNAA